MIGGNSLINFIMDEDLKNLILESGKDELYIKRELRHTLYLLSYSNYDTEQEISEIEISKINGYNNKKEFNTLFMMLLKESKSLYGF